MAAILSSVGDIFAQAVLWVKTIPRRSATTPHPVPVPLGVMPCNKPIFTALPP